MANDLTEGVTSPIVWRRWLARELVRLRLENRLKQPDTAKALRRSVPMVSDIESGKRVPTETELVEVLLPLYKVPKADRPRYVAASDAAVAPGWWDRWDEEDLPQAQRRFIGLEDGARQIRAFESQLIHGLLQTPEYAAAVIQRSAIRRASEKVARLVELRIVRQAVLRRPASPLDLRVVLDEGALRRQVGGPSTMRNQLLHTARVAEELENVTVQVVPYSAGAHGATLGPFSILEFPSANDHDVGLVYVEGFTQATFLEKKGEVDLHALVFEQLVALALTPEDSVDILRVIAEENDYA